jgi:hypothetical protein
MLAPLGLLPSSAAGTRSASCPLAQNLLSVDPVLYNHGPSTQAFVLPFRPGRVGGYARLERRRPGHWPVAVLVVAMVVSLALTPRTANNLAVARFAYTCADGRLPCSPRSHPEVAVTAQDPYVPHLSLRPRVFVFPVGIDKSDTRWSTSRRTRGATCRE